MADPRLIAVQLDDSTILPRRPEIEQERGIAIDDLLHHNHFRPLRAYPAGYAGPYRLGLSVAEGRLVIDVLTDGAERLETLVLSLGTLRRPIKDYLAICDSYYRAVANASPDQIEPIDMTRRALHNEAADALTDKLAGKIELDFDTARRLFTLICALHIRG